MTEDDFYRTSTQYRLWSFTPESLASLRATTNATAAEGVKAAFQSLKADTEHQDPSHDGYAASAPQVDCLTIEEEQRIVSYYCLQTLNFVDFCEYPTNVKVVPLPWPQASEHESDSASSFRRRRCSTSSASTSPILP